MPASVMAPAPVITRSSLEMMLDSIRRRDEQPKDAPPALPARPTSRARLPSSRRSLPPNFRVPRTFPECLDEGEVEKENQPPTEEEEAAVFKKEIFGRKRMDKVNHMENSRHVGMPELESYENCGEEIGLEISDKPPTSLKQPEVKAAALEDASNKTLQGILSVQKHFRGLQARLYYRDLKEGVLTLQSFVRGERLRHQYNFLVKRLRAAVLIQKYARRWVAWKTFHDHQKNVILLQSVIRGWLARKHFLAIRNLEMTKHNQVKVKRNADSNFEKMKDSTMECLQLHHPVLAELQMRVLKAETALRQKEEENVTLQKQLQQYETRWSEYEAKMKSMEDIWQRQMTSLQMSLAAAKKSLAADIIPGKPDASSVGLYYDSEDYLSAETRTPEGTPAKQPHAYSARSSDGALTAVSLLMKEFEQHKQVFEDDAVCLVEVKSRQSGSGINPDEELRKLKSRFAAWKKDFKVRLRDTKLALKKLGDLEPKKSRKKWWGKKTTTRT